MICEQINHSDDCYFCLVKITGFNRRNKKDISYLNLKSAIRPIFHSCEIPVPNPPINLDDMMQSDEEDNEVKGQYETGPDISLVDVPKLYCQEELNDLVCNFGLSKEHAELLGSSLKKKHLLSAGVTYSWYRHRQKEFTTFY